MLGKSEAVCLKSGDWNFQTMPECVPLSAEINNDLSAVSVTTEVSCVSFSKTPYKAREEMIAKSLFLEKSLITDRLSLAGTRAVSHIKQ